MPLCRVLLCDDSNFPCWLVLVPRVEGAREAHELPVAQQAQLWREAAAAARVVADLFQVCCVVAGREEERLVMQWCTHCMHAECSRPAVLLQPFKLNVATIGNIVSQLHLHVTGRLQVCACVTRVACGGHMHAADGGQR